MGQLNRVSVQALAHAWSLLPRAGELIGNASVDDLATFRNATEELARELGVEEPFVELAGELISEGAPDVAARAAALWAARRYYGIDPRIARELEGPSDEEIAADELAMLADAEERETEKFLALGYPAECAKRGESPEANAAWRAAVTDGLREMVRAAADAPVLAAGAPPEVKPAIGPLCDWPIDEIRNDVRRHMTGAERAIFRAELERVKPLSTDPETAPRAAMQLVIERRRRGRSAA